MEATVHLLLVPGPGVGHINGGMLLAKSLISAGFSISFVCFARSYHAHARQNRLRSLDPAIHFEVLEDGLSSSESYLDLFVVTATMQDSLGQLIERLRFERRPVCCIVSDSLMAWTQDVGDRFGIPRVDYWTATAASYLFTLAIPDLFSKGYLPQKDATNDWKVENPTLIDFIPGLTKPPLEELPISLRVADVSNPLVQRLFSAAERARSAERVFIHSLHELESGAFEGLREWGIEAYAIGPLIQNAFGHSGEKQECEKWLDIQSDSSVLYVSFGSNALVTGEEILELALGLEASGQPFLWVIRPDTLTTGELSDALPEGFESGTKGRGRIVSWAPQVAVLAHPAVGGFLTHCGWNSTLESIWMGVPMLGCPRGAEQRSNARFIAENWGVGMELGRTKEGGMEREEVERAVRALMMGKEGEIARSKARELREVARKTSMPGGHSHSNLLKFAEDMRNQHKDSDSRS